MAWTDFLGDYVDIDYFSWLIWVLTPLMVMQSSHRAVLTLSSVQALLFSNEGATHYTPLQLNSCCAHPLTGHTEVPFPHQ